MWKEQKDWGFKKEREEGRKREKGRKERREGGKRERKQESKKQASKKERKEEYIVAPALKEGSINLREDRPMLHSLWGATLSV